MNLEVGAIGPFTRANSLDVLARVPMRKHHLRIRTYAALFVLDCAAIVGAFMVANAIRFGDPFARAGMNVVVALVALYLVIASHRGLYGSDFFRDWRQNARRAVAAFGFACLAVLFLSFYLQASASMSRIAFTIGCGIAAPSTIVLRWALHRYAIWKAKGDAMTRIVICDRVPAPDDPVAITIDAAALGLCPDSSDPTARDRLGRIVHCADRVVVACPEGRRDAWAAVLKGCGVQGEIVVGELGSLGILGAASFAGAPTLIVSAGPLSLPDRLVKRGVDVAFAIVALAFIAPLMLLTALAVKLETRGPVLFVQPRLGRGNRLFPMYKFRSMRADLCDIAGNRSTERGDPRVTRVGRLIRATSIDELPQLLNVLKGDMSIVGPRPHALGSLAGDQLFWEVDHRYWNRHVAKPGITGLAQVRGFRGATHHRSDLVARLQADLEYMNGWSIWRDLHILLATLKVVLHRNAY